MKLTLANLSSVDDAAFAAATAAISTQVSRDFQPEWNAVATLMPTRMTVGAAIGLLDQATDAIIYFGDSTVDPTTGIDNLFGYHDENYQHVPYGFVYQDVCAKYNEPWSVALSHEVLELLADPTGVLSVLGPDPRGTGNSPSSARFDLEVCDPTQGDSYPINGIAVSNFVTKRYFNMAGGGVGTNHLNLALTSFGVRPKGYCQYDDGSASREIDGDRVDEDRLAGRALLARVRRSVRRAAQNVRQKVAGRENE
jgi:hypothetical protein